MNEQKKKKIQELIDELHKDERHKLDLVAASPRGFRPLASERWLQESKRYAAQAQALEKLLDYLNTTKTTDYEHLTKEQKKLLNAAEKVMETAYNPYSNFYVGAALLTKDGRIIEGSNVENAAYGSTICAERAALLRANAMGHRMFKSIAIIARGQNFKTGEVIKTIDVTGPCGSCRQMLYEASEISEQNLEVIMSTTDKGKIIISSIEELLPLAFGPMDLGVDVERFME